MATLFADGFDCYSTFSDMASTGMYLTVPVAGLTTSTPFGVGQAVQYTTTGLSAYFLTGSNEATIYGSLRLSIPSGTSASYVGLQFTDGGAAGTQCVIRFCADGSVGLYTGTSTLIQSYPGSYVVSGWHSWQFKVVINNTSGSIELRLDGSTSNLITKTSCNTRGSTANQYANGWSLYVSTAVYSVDDLYMSNAGWTGDLRALQQTPYSPMQSQFSVLPAASTQTTGAAVSASTYASGTAAYSAFVATATATVPSLQFRILTGGTGHFKLSVFDATGAGGGPGAVITNGNGTTVTNPAAGWQTVTFATPPSLTKGTTYWIGTDQDVSLLYYTAGTAPYTLTSTTAYASFPSSNPTTVTSTYGYTNIIITYDADNTFGVNQLIEDGDTSYVYASGSAEDKYSLSQITTTYGVVAVQYYACWRKTDAGSRTAQLSVAANGSADTALITNSAISTNYSYAIKTLDVDPTSAAWTPTTVNAAILGVAVV